MKKALIALYVIVAVQTVLTVSAFAFSYVVLKQVTQNIYEVCDQRYVHQQ